MERVNTILVTLFGVSWQPTVLGYLMAILTELDLYFKTGATLPTTFHEWLQFVLGIVFALYGKVTKQANVTHSPSATETTTPKPVDQG
jgi:hypothetical protein